MDTLIVCAANVCRSPAAEALWRAAVLTRGVAARVSSAGLQASPGARQSATMAKLLASQGIAMAERGATVFLPAIARRHQLVLVMEPAHQRAILSMAPDLAGRVHLLGRWGQGPIEDPMGGAVIGYRRCIEQMEAAVNAWLARLTAEGSQRGVLRNDKELARAS